MSITSYAQNFEDVMLWRALGHISNGFYIDVGAQHPVIDSVSKAFYEHGWRGLHVEATPAYATLLRQDRPDETVIQAAVNDKHGTITFFEIPETGISTGEAAIAESHRARGFNVLEITVACITLLDVFEYADLKEIHWLKIDVEGMELKVLQSWGKSKARPWIVVIESTLPLTQIENHQIWQQHLLDKGYVFVYFDGLNRYYLSLEQQQLAAAFSSGPNVFDGFALHGSASAPFCTQINEKHHQAEQALQKKFALLHQEKTVSSQQFDAVLERLTVRLRTSQEEAQKAKMARSDDVIKRVAEDLKWQAKVQTFHAQRSQSDKESLQREQAITEKLEVLRAQSAQESAGIARTHSVQQSELHHQHAAREQALHERLQAEQAQRWQLQQDNSAREKAMYEQVQAAQKTADNLLQSQVQRERDVSAQLLALQQKSMLESAGLLRALADQQTALHSKHISREQAVEEKAHNSQQEVEKRLGVQVQREKALAEKLDVVRAQAAQDSKDALRALAEQQTDLHNQNTAHEQALSQQRTVDDEQRRQLLQNYSQREKLLQEKTWQTNQEIGNLLRAQLLREQDMSAKLDEAQQQARLEKSALEQAQEKKIRELSQKYGQQEDALTSQLNAHQQALYKLQADHQALEQDTVTLLGEQSEHEFALQQQHAQHKAALTLHQQESGQQLHLQHKERAQVDQAFKQEIATLQNYVQTLREAAQQKAQQQDLLLNSKREEHTYVVNVCASLEERLQAEVQSGQISAQHLRKMLADVQSNLDATRATRSWRMTAPLRKLAGLFTAPKTQISPSASLSELVLHELEKPIVAEQKSNTTYQTTYEPAMPKPAPATPLLDMPTAASTLPELLAFHDQQFIHCAYQTLMNRMPDPDGLSYYLGRLKAGFSKIGVLKQLRCSAESESRVVNLLGLDVAIRRHQRGRLPVIGRLFRLLEETESEHPSQRKLRAIEHQLSLISDEGNSRYSHMETAIAQLHDLISTGTSAADQQFEPNGLKQLSPRARDIYFQLKTATAIHDVKVKQCVL